MIAEYKNGVLQREFIEGISTDEHICMIDADTGNKYFYILDTRNSVDKIVDESGTVVEDYEYTAYGDTKINCYTIEEDEVAVYAVLDFRRNPAWIRKNVAKE